MTKPASWESGVSVWTLTQTTPEADVVDGLLAIYADADSAVEAMVREVACAIALNSDVELGAEGDLETALDGLQVVAEAMAAANGGMDAEGFYVDLSEDPDFGTAWRVGQVPVLRKP